jgi:predicted  nucleic acid-binding Zn-ribbon protein
MQKTGLQNEIYVEELVVSGSTKITTKNETGIYVFQESNTKDGVVFGKMQKPKYNKNEVEQSIDVIITELLPVIPPEVPETVLKSVYDALMEERNDLTKEVEKLNKDILNLQAIINSLEIVNESLQVELDSKNLSLAAAENQAFQANSQVQSTISELQNALQKATSEAIQRVSAFAKNESLKNQVAQLEGQVKTATKQIESLNTTVSQQNGTIAAKDGELDNSRTLNANLQKSLTDAANKGSIICNMMYEQGFMPENIWQADQAYSKLAMRNDTKAILGYHMWARGVVDYLNKNPQYSKYLYNGLVKPWSEHMAYIMGTLDTDNLIGNVIHKVGRQYSLLTYKIHKLNKKYKRNKLSFGWQ